MNSFDLNYIFDEQLQEVPTNPVEMSAFVASQIEELQRTEDNTKKVKLLGEIGVYLRILRRLDDAEKYLLEAGSIISLKSLPISMYLSQQIRLAHVYQWKKNFKLSNAMFDGILKICDKEKNLGTLLDFSWQHAGKNYFDQRNWEKALYAFEKALELRKVRNAPQDQVESSIKSIEKVKSLWSVKKS